MTDSPANLAEVRAQKAEDCKLWTPRDLALALLRDIESGEIKPEQITVDFLEKTAAGRWRHGFFAAGVGRQERIALLELAKWRALEEWHE